MPGRKPSDTPVPVVGPNMAPSKSVRADAVRNRSLVLEAAERLFALRGVPEVTMDDIAAEAGVGKGTLYRRFGDKSGLAVAVLDQRERQLQARMVSGPPPLGPGAPPEARLAAFVGEYVRFATAHLDLIEMAETGSLGARFRSGAYALWVTHCRLLLAEAGAPDPGFRAECILAMLSGEQVRYWLQPGGHRSDEVAASIVSAALALML